MRQQYKFLLLTLKNKRKQIDKPHFESFGSGLKRIHDASTAAGVKYSFNQLKSGFVVVFCRGAGKGSADIGADKTPISADIIGIIITDEEYLLNLLNDVLDRKHSEDEIRKARNLVKEQNMPSMMWKQFVLEIIDEHPEISQFISTYLGS